MRQYVFSRLLVICRQGIERLILGTTISKKRENRLHAQSVFPGMANFFREDISKPSLSNNRYAEIPFRHKGRNEMVKM